MRSQISTLIYGYEDTMLHKYITYITEKYPYVNLVFANRLPSPSHLYIYQVCEIYVSELEYIVLEDQRKMVTVSEILRTMKYFNVWIKHYRKNGQSYSVRFIYENWIDP